MVTTLAGEKAAELGGIHLHRLIPLMPSKNTPVMKQVESTVQNIYRDPTRLVQVKKLDVLVVEEIGMLNSEHHLLVFALTPLKWRVAQMLKYPSLQKR